MPFPEFMTALKAGVRVWNQYWRELRRFLKSTGLLQRHCDQTM
jgi:hypothetical protein